VSSREMILSELRKQRHPGLPLPEFQKTSLRGELRRQFSEAIESVGGLCVAVRDDDALNAALRHLAFYPEVKRVLSRVSGIQIGNIDENCVGAPHQLWDLDLAILAGVFGVAENGAVWINDNCLGQHRGTFVIAQHLVLVIPADQIVPTMHEAYERINFSACAFGCFVSGPSKTADIEQALVIGAHGARSCTIFLVDYPKLMGFASERIRHQGGD